MASFTDTFERKEVKYRLNAKQHREVLDALAGRMAADEYGRTRITSLYFDTPTRDLIARSLEKPLYKEKLRLRWYGTPTSGERVYVEIKKKYDGIVYERTAYAPVPGVDADGLRITFDSGVAYRDVLAGERGAGSAFHPLLGLGETIMEVKTAGAYPSWLVEVLGGCQADARRIRRRSASTASPTRSANVPPASVSFAMPSRP
jgi:hypothetical protein